jgi:hypothetical protein
MTTSGWFGALAAVSLLGALVVTPAAPAAAQSSEWNTDFGPLVLTVRGGYTVTGLFPAYHGRVSAQLVPEDRQIIGFWLQPSSEVRCAEPQDGTHYWGQVSWSLRQDGTLRGQWGYCWNPPGSAGVWNGTFVKGTLPISGGGDQGATPGKQTIASAPAPAPSRASSAGGPGPDAMEVVRFLWGQNADPARLKVLKEDVSCDGKPDLTLIYLDLDSPDGPFLSVAVRETGATLEQIPATYLDFDTGGFASLCGPARMVDVTVPDLEPETVLDLTGFTSPPVCRVGLRLDDGMCDAVWVFTKPGQDRLTDLIIGRN